jgi:hypothetical protein
LPRSISAWAAAGEKERTRALRYATHVHVDGRTGRPKAKQQRASAV